MRLKGKRVLITGTAGGQDAAAQALFVREGARVVGCDVLQGAAERSAQALRDQGYDTVGSTVDLADPVAAREWVELGADSLGGIDVLPLCRDVPRTMAKVIQVELNIVFHTTQPAWRHLVDGGGAVINTASVSGRF